MHPKVQTAMQTGIKNNDKRSYRISHPFQRKNPRQWGAPFNAENHKRGQTETHFLGT